MFRGIQECYGNTDPIRKLRHNELCWSLLTTEIGYKVDTTEGPYSSFNTCGLYQRFEGLNCCVGEPSEEYCDRFEEVSAFLSVTGSASTSLRVQWCITV